jgi:hypothetical protein
MTASFAIAFKDEIATYRLMSTFVLPSESLKLRVVAPSPGSRYTITAVEPQKPRDVAAHKPASWQPTPGEAAWSWTWKAPAEPGIYALVFQRSHGGPPEPHDTVRLNVVVMVPATRVRDGVLEGYKIGRYPSKPLRGLALYNPPAGFVRVTQENEDTLLTPHFRLRQFLCKQKGGYPKFVVLRERLLLKLEALLAIVNEKGIRADSFAVLSGYRTPSYNKSIGNVQYSRHVWGGAADIYVDASPADGMMDDLNGDGRSDKKDAGVLYRLIDAQFGVESYQRFVGGLGRYPRTSRHGPFVHVDVRGFRARWGD